METADDLSIWKYARQNGFVIVTKDSDFHELSLLYGIPPKVIWLKCGNRPKSYILNLLLDNQAAIEAFINDDRTVCLELY